MKLCRGFVVLAVLGLAVLVCSQTPPPPRGARYSVWSNSRFCKRRLSVAWVDPLLHRKFRITAIEACRTALRRAVGVLFFQIESNTHSGHFSPSVHLLALKAKNGQFGSGVVGAFQTYASMDAVVEYTPTLDQPGFKEDLSTIRRFSLLQRINWWTHLRVTDESIDGTPDKIYTVTSATRPSGFTSAWGNIVVGVQITPQPVEGRNGTVRYRLRPSSFKMTIEWENIKYDFSNTRIALGFTVVTRGVVARGETKEEGSGLSKQRVMSVSAGTGEEDGGFLAFAEEGYDADGNGPYAVDVSDVDVPTRNRSEWHSLPKFTARRVWVSLPVGQPSSFYYDPEIGIGGFDGEDGVSSLLTAAPSKKILFSLVSLVSFLLFHWVA